MRVRVRVCVCVCVCVSVCLPRTDDPPRVDRPVRPLVFGRGIGLFLVHAETAVDCNHAR